MTDAYLPYGGTSGFSGSSTSEERAEREDHDGTMSERQHNTLHALSGAAEGGLTWRELAGLYGWHHGQASGVLSVLHKVGRIQRLNLTRRRCKVYVLPEYVDGREVEAHGRPKKIRNVQIWPVTPEELNRYREWQRVVARNETVRGFREWEEEFCD